MIRIDNMSFGYKQHNVLNNLDLQLEGGQVCGLLGLNGEGKSTLLYLLSGLLRARSGSIMVNGLNPAQSTPSFLGNLYLLPEDAAPHALSLRKMANRLSKFYPRFSFEVFNKVASLFSVDIDSPLSSLSMGQAKKGHMCIAFACQTSVLLLDEPTNGLDIPSKMIWRKAVAECMDDEKLIIISSHQVRDFENMLDRVLILNSGRLVFNHTIGEIGQRLAFEEVGASDLRGDELFSIPSAMGHRVVRRQTNPDAETLVDFEMLFSAVLGNAYGIQQIFC